MHKNAEKLADLIEKYPGANFQIDNDSWVMLSFAGSDRVITDSDKLKWETDFYGSSKCYGAGIAEALIILLNSRGLNITAESV
jgi:hypothetical protein